MALSLDAKDRVRKHMGYPSVAQINTYFLGFPAAMEPFFFLEGNMNVILPTAEGRCMDLLSKLDALDQQIFDDADALVASEVGDIVLRDDEYEKLLQRYMHFRGELCNLLASPPNPFDLRFTQNSVGINVSVR